MAPVSSPCVGVCTLDPAAALCLGCGRTLDEIAAWAGLGAAERRAVMAALPGRLAQVRPPALDAGAAGSQISAGARAAPGAPRWTGAS